MHYVEKTAHFIPAFFCQLIIGCTRYFFSKNGHTQVITKNNSQLDHTTSYNITKKG